MEQRRATGRFGEEAAARYLNELGYQIVARNWRCPLGEVDIIARDGAELVFVEVRTRHGFAHGSAAESITRAKQRRLIALAAAYLNQPALPVDRQDDWRIDVIAIQVGPQGRIELDHIANAIEGDRL